jgi:hypothetical protein
MREISMLGFKKFSFPSRPEKQSTCPVANAEVAVARDDSFT